MICPKCGSRFILSDGWDRRAKGERIHCFCGLTLHWRNQDGSIYVPPPWVPEDEFSVAAMVISPRRERIHRVEARLAERRRRTAHRVRHLPFPSVTS